MNIQNLLNQFMGQGDGSTAGGSSSSGLSSITNAIPGGLVGCAAAGGIIALLVGSKSARKFAGKAAGYGGAAVLGGLAFKAYSSWQQDKPQSAQPVDSQTTANMDSFVSEQTLSNNFQFTLVKAMISAAKSDGHIDAVEQKKIFDTADKMQLSSELKAVVFDLLQAPSSVEELASEAVSLEQKTEVYLASCLAIDIDHPAEKQHIDRLANALNLPAGLDIHIQNKAKQALLE